MSTEAATQSALNETGLSHPRWKTEAIHFTVLTVAVLICWIPRLRGPIDLRWDGAVYYVLGTSLAEGHGYRLLNEPGNIEANQYPPMLPAIIAAHQLILGTNDPIIVGRWLRITYFLFFNLYVFTIYLVAVGYLPSKYALLATVICVFGLFTYFMSDLSFPEIPFALATTLFVLFNRNSGKRTDAVFAGLFAVVAYALRTAGIALLAAWVGESVIKKDLRRAMFRSVVSGIAVFSWLLYISAVESGQSYKNPSYEYQRADYLWYNVSYARNIFKLIQPFAPERGSATLGDITSRYVQNLRTIPGVLGESISSTRNLWAIGWHTLTSFSPFRSNAPWVVDLTLITLGFLILGGVGIQLARQQWLIPLYILLSIATMCFTPFPEQFSRYMAPLTPFLVICLFTLLLSLQDVWRDALPGRRSAVARIFTTLVVGTVLVVQASTFLLTFSRWHQKATYTGRDGETVSYRLFFNHDAQRAFDAGIDWLRTRAKANDVVASSMPHWLYLRSGLKSVMPPYESDPAKAQRLLDSVPVNYLIVDDGLATDTRRYTVPVTQKFPNYWKRIYSDFVITEAGEKLQDRFGIYERVHQ